MREAVVVASSRTPLAKSFRGSFNLTRPDDLAAHCIRDVLRKVPQVDPAEIGDVILGCADPHGQQGRTWPASRLVRAGLAGDASRAPPSTASARPACRRSRWRPTRSCTKASMSAIGGGVESITASAQVKVDPKITINPWVDEQKPGIYMVMGDTAEVVAKRYKISREAQDEYSLSSQQRTARAQREGFFDEELAPMQRHARHPRQEDRADRRPGRASVAQGRVQPAGHDARGTARA